MRPAGFPVTEADLDDEVNDPRFYVVQTVADSAFAFLEQIVSVCRSVLRKRLCSISIKYTKNTEKI